MARRTPAAERTVAVLNFLAANRDRRYSLSDLARELELNKATAHALLATLVDAGMLVRDHDEKTYALGPALIPLGAAARATFPAADLAQAPMDELASDLDLQCVASVAIGDQIVILATSELVRPIGFNIEPGQRLPLVPPLGAVFVAWSGQERIDRWLSGLPEGVGDAERQRHLADLDAVRRRGWSVGLAGDEQQRMVESLVLPRRQHRPPGDGHEYALLDLTGTDTHVVNHVGAPVFDQRGDVVMALFLIGFRGAIPAADIAEYGARVVDAAEQVSARLHGRLPVT